MVSQSNCLGCAVCPLSTCLSHFSLFLFRCSVIYQHGFDEKDFDRFEHDLESGDHVFRWEMIVCPPVIYPIQIHGIVLEAGRNCVIIADFGLTGYGKQEGASFNHAQDHNASIMAAWKKLRPKEDQRLNILTLLDPKEIRKWKRANYEASFVENHTGGHKLGKSLTKFFKSTTKTNKNSSDSIATDATVAEDERERTASEDSGSVGGRLSKFFSKSAVIKKQDSAVTDATVVHENSSGDTKEHPSDSDLKEDASGGVVEEASDNVAAVSKDECTSEDVKETMSGEAKEINENNSKDIGNEEESSKKADEEKRDGYMEQPSGLESVSLEEEEEENHQECLASRSSE